MGPPGVAMGPEHQRGEGRPPEKQGMGWGQGRKEPNLGARQNGHGRSRTHFDPMRVEWVRVTPTLGALYISKFCAFNLRQFAILTIHTMMTPR